MLFSEDSYTGSILKDFDFSDSCGKCFYNNKKCKCSDLTIKNKKELIVKGLEKNESGK
jgi:hypothetical protein